MQCKRGKGQRLDTRFSIAIHLLVLISEADEPLSSAQMAESVGTNPSFVRKVLGSLKKAGLVSSQRGRAGFALMRPPRDISLLQVHQAVYGSDEVELFGMHQNPNDACLVGRYIQPTLRSAFGKIQAEAERTMANTSLADCIATMRTRAESDGTL